MLLQIRETTKLHIEDLAKQTGMSKEEVTTAAIIIGLIKMSNWLDEMEEKDE